MNRKLIITGLLIIYVMLLLSVSTKAQVPLLPDKWDEWTPVLSSTADPDDDFLITPSGCGLQISQWGRGSGLLDRYAGNGINSSRFEGIDLMDAVNSADYIHFSISTDQLTTIDITEFKFLYRRSPFDSSFYCILMSDVNSPGIFDSVATTRTLTHQESNFTISQPLTIDPNQTVEFRLYVWGLKKTTTFRIKEESSITATYTVAVPAISINSVNSSNSFCLGDIIEFEASTLNEGASPVFQWQKNGIDIPGANFSTYLDDSLIDNDLITCFLQSSCAILGDTVMSNQVYMIAILPSDTIIYLEICESELPVIWNGINIPLGTISNNDFQFDTINSFDCDSTVTLHLTVNSVMNTIINKSICEGDFYSFNNQDLTVEGIYYDTLQNFAGCDSIIVLNLSVDPVFVIVLDERICEGDFYSFNNQDLTDGGIYSDTLQSSVGCDSIIVLNLSVDSIVVTVLEESICEGSFYSFNNQDLTDEGIYVDTFQSISGCDSIVVLNLSVDSIILTVLEESICEGSFYVFSNQDLTDEGIYSDTLQSSAGCDSIVVLNLSVDSIVVTVLEESICEGSFYSFNNQDLTDEGIYVDTFQSISGCDSIVVLNLSVDSIILTVLEESICEGSFYVFSNQDLTDEGIYSDTLQSFAGCDSIVVLNLFVDSIVVTVLDESICEGDFYSFNNQDLTDEGIYVDTFQSISGCDSIIVLNLSVDPVFVTVLDERICEGDFYSFNNQDLTVEGIYSDTLQSFAGCDSIIVLNLSVDSIILTVLDKSICEGSFYIFNNQDLTDGGIYSDTLQSFAGCDSIIVLNLSVDSIILTVLDKSICEGSFYIFNNQDLTDGGIYSDTLQSISGCDSIIVLNLSVDSIIVSVLEESICEGSFYVFNNQDLTDEGIYSDTLESSAGCDSIVVLNLSVDSIIVTVLEESICEGDFYSFNNQDLTVEGIYSDTLQSISGCDSIIVLNLSVNSIILAVLDESICEGSSFAFNNQDLTDEGIYSDTLQSSVGCDSIIVLNLSVDSIVVTVLEESICEGSFYIFNNQDLTDEGIYSDTLQSISGCDSIVVLNLSVDSIFVTVLEESICEGDFYLFNNQDLTGEGIYSDTLQSSAGCDSIVVLNLSVDSLIVTVLEESICEGSFYVFNTQDLTDEGIYSDTLQSFAGCDSIVVLNLSVDSIVVTVLEESICEGSFYVFNNQDLTDEGIYSDTLQSFAGCDSIVVLNLFVDSIVVTVLEESICEGDFYSFNNQDLTDEGIYSDTLQSISGCDSIVVLNLSVDSIIVSVLEESICEGSFYVFNNQDLTDEGIYVDTFQSISGCDSIVVLNLFVDSIFVTVLEESICEGDFYSFNNQDLTVEGIYSDTLQSFAGCDSIIVLNLSVDPVVVTVLEENICEGSFYVFNNQDLTDEGVYYDTLQSSAGCDSIIVLNLFVDPVFVTVLDERICEGDFYSFNNQDLTDEGVYYDTLQSSAGCDSIIVLNLFVDPVFVTVLDERICEGDFYSFNNQDLTDGGIYSDTLQSFTGCDSIIVLNLSVDSIIVSVLEESICEGSFYVFSNQDLTDGGIYSDTLQSFTGCDSIVVLNLSVDSIIVSVLEESICEGSFYVFNNQDLTDEGIYVDTFQSISGCDSIIVLNLSVDPVFVTVLDERICEGDFYSFNNQDLTNEGIYSDTLQSISGCDSIIVLNLFIDSIVVTVLEESICEGDFYVFSNQDLTDEGIYVDTFQNISGCDSIIVLNLSVDPVFVTVLDERICEGDFYSFNNQDLTNEGIYVDTFQSISGCDSIIVLNLSVDPIFVTVLDERICEGDFYSFNNQDLTNEGIYSDTLQSISGCDSIIVLNLSVDSIVVTVLEESICEGSFYSFNNQDLTDEGIYSDTLQSISGCDSIIVLNLSVDSIILTVLEESICEGSFYVFSNQDLTDEGIYSDTLQSFAGCDSIVVLNLSVDSIIVSVLEESICEGDFYSFNNQDLTNEGIYSDTLQSISGCDSIVVLNLSVDSIFVTVLEESICEGSFYVFSNQDLTDEGIYSDTLQSISGCDSIIVLNLSVDSIVVTVLEESICEGSYYVFNNQDLTDEGVYFDTLQSFAGCDSIIVLNLSVDSIIVTVLEESICEGSSYVFNNQDLTDEGIYSDTLQSFAGCDSIVVLNLSVDFIIVSVLEESICEGDFYSFNNQDLTDGGIYSDTLQSFAGCDSIVVLNLSVDSIIVSVLEESICEGDFYSFNNQDLTDGGMYYDTLQSSAGCDSIVVLNLSVDSIIVSVLEESICEGSFYVFNTQDLTDEGIYSDTLQSFAGCDSIVVLNLSVDPIVVTVLDESICEGDFYSFNNQDLTNEGIYSDTLQSISGCDSIVVLNLSVDSIFVTVLEESICEGDFYLFNNQDLTDEGIYSDTLQSFAGCDSIVILNLSVDSIFLTVLEESICEGSSFAFNNQDLTDEGIYSDTLQSFAGCDSIVVLNLSVDSLIVTVLEESICEGDFYSFNNQDLTDEGIYSDTLQSISGCDSIVVLNLSVDSIFVTVLEGSICEGDFYLFNNQDLTDEGIYSDTLQSISGCDSIVVLNLSVDSIIVTVLDERICEGDFYLFNNQDLTDEGIYSDTLQSFAGCDSIVVLNLSVDSIIVTVLEESICEGSFYVFNNQDLTDEGIYSDTLQSSASCDSIIVLNLSVDSIVVTVLEESICEGDFYSFNNQDLTVEGIYSDTLQSISGCDSILVLNLSVDSIIVTVLEESICEGSFYVFSNQDLTDEGIYSDTLQSFAGCDSIVILNLSVDSIVVTVLEESICEGSFYVFSNQDLTDEGIYSDTLQSSVGCDSIVVLNLDVNPAFEHSIDLNVCFNQLPIVWNGTSVMEGGDQITSYYTTTALGCDSIVHLNLKISLEPIESVVNIEGCDSVSWNNQFYYNDSSFVDTIQSILGCDSIFEIVNIIVHKEQPEKKIDSFFACKSLVFEGVEYFENEILTDTLYTVNGCDSFYRTVEIKIEHLEIELLSTATEVFEGEPIHLFTDGNYPYNIIAWTPLEIFPKQSLKEQHFIADFTRTYTVFAKNENECMDSASLEIIVHPIIDEIFMPNAFSPNGDGLNDFYNPEFLISGGFVVDEFLIHNRYGQLIFQNRGQLNKGWDGTVKGKPAEMGTYFYHLKVKFINGKTIHKKGEFHLIR